MSDATSTLAEFLLARIADDEALARAAADRAQWQLGEPPALDWEVVAPRYRGISVWPAGYNTGDPTTAVTVHMQRHDPARVLADCDARRRIVAELGDYDDGHVWATSEAARAESALRLLALPYADHPDYRPEWRP